jgi:hypothetical protein
MVEVKMKRFNVHIWFRENDPDDMPMWVMDSDIDGLCLAAETKEQLIEACINSIPELLVSNGQVTAEEMPQVTVEFVVEARTVESRLVKKIELAVHG